MQGVRLDPEALAHLLRACVAAPAWDAALQLCSSALVAQVRASGARAWLACSLPVFLPSKQLETCPSLSPSNLQGASAAPLFNFLLHRAADAHAFDAVVGALTAMRGAGLEVAPAVAAQVRAVRAVLCTALSCSPPECARCSVFFQRPSSPPLAPRQVMGAQALAGEGAAPLPPLPRTPSAGSVGGGLGGGAFASLPGFAAATASHGSASSASLEALGRATSTPPPSPASAPPRAFTLADANALLEGLKV